MSQRLASAQAPGGAPRIDECGSAEALRRLEDRGPNAIIDVAQHPVRRAVGKLWAPVPWMLEAAILLQLGLGEHVEAGVTVEVGAELAVIVANHELRRDAEGRGFSKLLGCPLCGRVSRDASVSDSLGVGIQDEEGEDRLKPNVVGLQEVTCLHGMAAQEGTPTLPGRSAGSTPSACAVGRCVRNANSEFEQLTPNAFGSQSRFSAALRQMSPATSCEMRRTGVFVDRDFQRQSKRKPSRCRRRTVSGFASRASRHFGSAAVSSVIKVRSWGRNIGRFHSPCGDDELLAKKPSIRPANATDPLRGQRSSSGRDAPRTALAGQPKTKRSLAMTPVSTTPICSDQATTQALATREIFYDPAPEQRGSQDSHVFSVGFTASGEDERPVGSDRKLHVRVRRQISGVEPQSEVSETKPTKETG